MMTLAETAKYVRSKNAGPFWMTIDIFCNDDESYNKIKNSTNLTPEKLKDIYGVSTVEKYVLDDLKVVKFSMPRPFPQGSPHDADMHAGQQYIRILDIEL